MMQFAFISRHQPTPSQHTLAQEAGIQLVVVGDMDAFTVTTEQVEAFGDFEGVVVVHPAMAMRLMPKYRIGVFENSNRAPAGEKPQFEARALHLYPIPMT